MAHHPFSLYSNDLPAPGQYYGYKAEKVDGKGWLITNIQTKPDPSLLCECGSGKVWIDCGDTDDCPINFVRNDL